LKLLVGQDAAASPLSGAGTPSAAPQHAHVIAALCVPIEQRLERRQHAVGPHRATLIGDVIEHPRVLAAPYLIDGKPPQAGVEQRQVGHTLTNGAQPRSLSPEVLLADCLERVALGRELFLAALALGCGWVVAALRLAQRPRGKLARCRQGERRVNLGRAVRLGLLGVPVDEAGAERELPLQPTEAIADDEALAPGGEDDDAQALAAVIADLEALGVGAQIGNSDGC
jgi:hypothetical protein